MFDQIAMPAAALTHTASLAAHLQLLETERALAALDGLADDRAYMADLLDEIAACRAAYVGAAVTEIAVLRAALDARHQG